MKGNYNRLFIYLLLAIFGLSSLYGCGSESTASQGEPNPPGVFTDSTFINHLKKDFDDLKACTGLSKGEFEEVTIVVMPPSFPCRWYDGECSGEYNPPNTIKLGSPYLWKHEAIHYLLHVNNGNSDSSHQSPLFQSCI